MITPIGDTVIILRDKNDDMTKSGILVQSENQEQRDTGVVVAIGEDVKIIKIGMRVLMNSYAQDISIDGSSYVRSKESEIIGYYAD